MVCWVEGEGSLIVAVDDCAVASAVCRLEVEAGSLVVAVGLKCMCCTCVKKPRGNRAKYIYTHEEPKRTHARRRTPARTR